MQQVNFPIKFNEIKEDRTRIVLVFGLAIVTFIILLMTLSNPTPRSITVLISIMSSGVYTLLLYLTRKHWIALLAGRPVRNACLLGIFNAAVVETIFWSWQSILGSSGVAASSNLLVDFIITMPWYTGMVILFVRAQDRRRFSISAILLLGGLYETGADGIVGNMIFGHGMFSPGAWVLLAISFWGFILVYSSMVILPALLIDRAAVNPKPSYPSWVDALSPFLWLILYAIYLAVLLGGRRY
jgi:hypothetical protein